MSRSENAPTTRKLAKAMVAIIDIYCTSYPATPPAVTLYDALGQTENLIKRQKTQLASDPPPTPPACAHAVSATVSPKARALIKAIGSATVKTPS